MGDALHPLPLGAYWFKLSRPALELVENITTAVKESEIMVTHLKQRSDLNVPDNMDNGIVSTKQVALSEHYRLVYGAESKEANGMALYMHNKSLIEVAGPVLTHRLYTMVPFLSQDVLVKYPRFYATDNPSSSSDVLIGGSGSWSPLHQDLPLYCTSVVMVLEGDKEFAVLSDEVAHSLRINLTSAAWEEPAEYGGQKYSTLRSLVEATGGAIVRLQPGECLVMPPRVFHFARNCALTISCNFSVCSMKSVPGSVAKTLSWIEKRPQNKMKFDRDFAQLLDDCTQAMLKPFGVDSAGIKHKTEQRRLPQITSILAKSAQLFEWYVTLQCIPKDWVVGFWDIRDRLLAQLTAALPIYTGGSGRGGGGAHADVTDGQPKAAGGAGTHPGVAANGFGVRPRAASGARAHPRPAGGGDAYPNAPHPTRAANAAGAPQPNAGGAATTGGGPKHAAAGRPHPQDSLHPPRTQALGHAPAALDTQQQGTGGCACEAGGGGSGADAALKPARRDWLDGRAAPPMAEARGKAVAANPKDQGPAAALRQRAGRGRRRAVAAVENLEPEPGNAQDPLPPPPTTTTGAEPLAAALAGDGVPGALDGGQGGQRKRRRKAVGLMGGEEPAAVLVADGEG